jgi:hypothetical protein
MPEKKPKSVKVKALTSQSCHFNDVHFNFVEGKEYTIKESDLPKGYSFDEIVASLTNSLQPVVKKV